MGFLIIYLINIGINILLCLIYCTLKYKDAKEDHEKFEISCSEIFTGIFFILIAILGTIFLILTICDEFDDVAVFSLETKEKEYVFKKKWVSLKKKRPNVNTNVLVYAPLPEHNGQLIDVAHYTSNGFTGSDGAKDLLKKVTHWMELPDPPKQ